MALRIACDDTVDRRVRFGYSPASEACHALHCLSFPDHHPQQMPWITEMREHVPQGLYRRLVEFGQSGSGEWTGPTRLFDAGGFAPLELEVTRLRVATEADVRTSVGRRESLNLDDQTEGELQAAVDRDPVGWRDYACDLLEAFWPYFVPTWHRLSRELGKTLSDLYTDQQRGAPAPVLIAAISEHIDWNEEVGEMVVARVVDRHVSGSSFDSLVVQPSHFALPHTWVEVCEQLVLTVGVSSDLGAREFPAADDLAASMKALADPVRLKIVALLLGSDRSTQELAGILHLTAPAVSRHLRKLLEAGVVRRVGRTARGMYVKYALEPEAGRDLGRKIAGIFEEERHGIRPTD